MIHDFCFTQNPKYVTCCMSTMFSDITHLKETEQRI